MATTKQITLLMFFMISMLMMLGACSKKTFTAAEGSVYQQCLDVRPEVKCMLSCKDGGCVEDYDYTITTDQQVKDILFVVDVSGSMSEEQAKMGSMFPNFLNILSTVDYRIAITTTDVRDASDLRSNTNPADSINGHGAFQDGNLVPFNDGSSFLNGSLPLLTEQSFFEQTITWEQTLTCEQNNYVEMYCPSGDERGILAAAMTFEKNPKNFIRPVGHMAVVILSDEDEGSSGIIVEPEREQPQNFINYFRNIYPNKSLSVHSIVIQPGNSSCYNAEDRPGHPPGHYGNTYAELTSLTEGGVLGDICAPDSNYSNQLQDIGASVSQVREILPCSPINGEVQVDLIPQPMQPIDVIKNLSQNEILFSRPIPEGTKIRFRFQCEEGA